MSTASLKDVEKKYEELLKENDAVSYADYAREALAENEESFAKQRLSALAQKGMSASDYGSAAERVGRLGLSGGGYSGFVKSKLQARASAKLGSIDGEERAASTSIKKSYLSYLEDYGKKQDALRRSITKTLSSKRVLDPEEIYAYARAAGLSSSSAKGLYDSVYGAVSQSVKNEILSKVYMNEITPDIAASYAKGVGLTGADVEAIREAALKYRREYASYSQDYLDYLESLSDKNTVSYG